MSLRILNLNLAYLLRFDILDLPVFPYPPSDFRDKYFEILRSFLMKPVALLQVTKFYRDRLHWVKPPSRTDRLLTGRFEESKFAGGAFTIFPSLCFTSFLFLLLFGRFVILIIHFDSNFQQNRKV